MTSGALTRFRVMAWVTGVMLLFNSVFGLSFLPWFLGHGISKWTWQVHGWVYLLYVASVLQLAYQLRWGVIRTGLVLLAAMVPFMSFVAERRVVADLRQAPTAPVPAAPATPS